MNLHALFRHNPWDDNAFGVMQSTGSICPVLAAYIGPLPSVIREQVDLSRLWGTQTSLEAEWKRAWLLPDHTIHYIAPKELSVLTIDRYVSPSQEVRFRESVRTLTRELLEIKYNLGPQDRDTLANKFHAMVVRVQPLNITPISPILMAVYYLRDRPASAAQQLSYVVTPASTYEVLSAIEEAIG